MALLRRNRPLPVPYVSAVEALAMIRAGHKPEYVVALVPAGRERRRFERAVSR